MADDLKGIVAALKGVSPDDQMSTQQPYNIAPMLDVEQGVIPLMGGGMGQPTGGRGTGTPRKYFAPGEAEAAYREQTKASMDNMKNRYAEIRATRDQPQTSVNVQVINQLNDKIKLGNATPADINLYNALVEHHNNGR